MSAENVQSLDGLGWALEPEGEFRGHSVMSLMSRDGIVVVVMSNRSGADTSTLARTVAEAFVK